MPAKLSRALGDVFEVLLRPPPPPPAAAPAALCVLRLEGGPGAAPLPPLRGCLARLAAALAGNRTLRELSLAGCCYAGCGDGSNSTASSFGDDAVIALRAALAGHPLLRRLDLSGCGVTDAGAGAVAGVLAARRGKRCELAWVRGLRGPPPLPAAAAPPVAADPATAGAGAGAGSGAFCLDELRLSGNDDLTDAGAALLAAELRESCRGAAAAGGGAPAAGVARLELRRCALTEASAGAFKAALAEATGGARGAGAVVDLRDNDSGGGGGCCAPSHGVRGDRDKGAACVLWGPMPAARQPWRPPKPRAKPPLAVAAVAVASQSVAKTRPAVAAVARGVSRSRGGSTVAPPAESAQDAARRGRDTAGSARGTVPPSCSAGAAAKVARRRPASDSRAGGKGSQQSNSGGAGDAGVGDEAAVGAGGGGGGGAAGGGGARLLELQRSLARVEALVESLEGDLLPLLPGAALE